MWTEIVQMFTSMPWYIIVPLCLGVVLLLIECFVPGFGFFGISGLSCLAGGIIAQGILFKSIVQILVLLLIFTFVILLLFLIFIRSAKYGLISRTPFIMRQTAVPVDYSDEKKNTFNKLVGQRGIATTEFNPSGKFMIDDEVYQGITAGEMIEINQVIKVITIEGNKIRVEKVEV